MQLRLWSRLPMSPGSEPALSKLLESRKPHNCFPLNFRTNCTFWILKPSLCIFLMFNGLEHLCSERQLRLLPYIPSPIINIFYILPCCCVHWIQETFLKALKTHPLLSEKSPCQHLLLKSHKPALLGWSTRGRWELDKPDWGSSEQLDTLRVVVEVRQRLGSGPAAGRSPSKHGDLKLHRRIAWASSQLQKKKDPSWGKGRKNLQGDWWV